MYTIAKVNEHYSYMAKNTYWFDCWENLSYFQEDWPNRQHEIGRKIYLVPSGFKGYEIQEGTIVTTDADAFWAPLIDSYTPHIPLLLPEWFVCR